LGFTATVICVINIIIIVIIFSEAGNGDHGGKPPAKVKVKQEKITDGMPVKKKRDRFNGMPEEEVIARGLPDHLAPNLDIVIVGINPGLMAAYVGHHYAGPGNHFCKYINTCVFLCGFL
jgi:TDG/mug DNA glycosylase family protein